MKFCSNCGSATTKRVPPGDAVSRVVCDACGEIHYQNPKLVVGSIPEWEGRILLCRRAIEPRYGYWTLPAGYMENGESTGQAAIRETFEEAGAKVELIAAYSMVSIAPVNQVHLFFRARLLDLDFSPGEESIEVALFDPDKIPWPELSFRTVAMALQHWKADAAQGSFGFHCEELGAGAQQGTPAKQFG